LTLLERHSGGAATGGEDVGEPGAQSICRQGWITWPERVDSPFPAVGRAVGVEQQVRQRLMLGRRNEPCGAPVDLAGPAPDADGDAEVVGQDRRRLNGFRLGAREDPADG